MINAPSAAAENPIIGYLNEGLSYELPGINATVGATLAGLAAIGIGVYLAVRAGKNLVGAR